MIPGRTRWGAAFVAALFAVAGAVSGAGAQERDLVFLDAPLMAQPTSHLLLDITRAGDRLIAVGASGLIVISDDSGSTWRQASVPVSATLTAVDFPTPELGWAVGHAGVVLHSADAGENWSLQFDGRKANAALLAHARERRQRLEAALEAADVAGDLTDDALADLEYAVEDAIFLEEDVQLAVDTGPADPLLDVRFADGRRGFAAGAYGMLLRTDDGGASWHIAIDGLANPNRFHLYGLLLTAGGGVYIAGEAGLLFRSMDGGQSFARYDDVYDGSFFGLLEAPSGILAYGLRGNQFRYDREADEWLEVPSPLESSLYGAARLDDGTLLLLGAGGDILRRSVEGRDQLQLHPSRATLADAVQAPDGRVWLVGMDGLVSYAGARDQ